MQKKDTEIIVSGRKALNKEEVLARGKLCAKDCLNRSKEPFGELGSFLFRWFLDLVIDAIG